MRWLFPLLLVGCAIADPRGLIALARLDPLSADPGAMTVRLDLPEGLRVRGAALAIEARRGEVSEGAVAAILQGPDGLWRVSEADLPAWRAAAARIRAWEAADPDGTSGSLTVSVTGCAEGAGPAPDARVSAALSPAPGAPFAPILTRAPVSAVLSGTRAGRCGEEAP